MWNILELESETLMFHVEQCRPFRLTPISIFGADRVGTGLRPVQAEQSSASPSCPLVYPGLCEVSLFRTLRQRLCSTWNTIPPSHGHPSQTAPPHASHFHNKEDFAVKAFHNSCEVIYHLLLLWYIC